MQPLLWTSRSLRNLVKELAKQGQEVCPTVVGNLLRDMGYSLQANSKTREGSKHIDRDAQFQYINAQAKAFLATNGPVISVDTKKKEPVGNFKNGGGGNGYRLRLWKVELQKLADELQRPITVCHFPPGTSKWNKIEYRPFSFITINWRGKPLRTFRTIVQLIAATTTEAGLKVRAELDENKYPKGIKVSDAQLAAVNLSRTQDTRNILRAFPLLHTLHGALAHRFKCRVIQLSSIILSHGLQ
jgi:hypothetical protein